MRKFILATILALTALVSTSISSAEAQVFRSGPGTLFQNAYNRAPYYNMNNTPGPYFGSGHYNSSYYNNPYTSSYYAAPYYGSASTYYSNPSFSTPYYSQSYYYTPNYSGYWNGVQGR